MAVGIMFGCYQNWQIEHKLIALTVNKPRSDPDVPHAPYYNEIMSIIKPLEYTVVPSLLTQPDITLSIDPVKKTWTLHKFHQFDHDGNVIIENDRYGLCGELASFTYRKIKPILGDKFTVKFANVAQSGYFLHPSGSHVILLIYDNSNNQAYLIDPGLHRYGPIGDYQDYLYKSFAEDVEGINEHQEDVTYQINHGMPLLIYNEYISVFTVEDVNGKFDKNNFCFTVQSNRRYDYEGRYFLLLKTENGKVSTFEDKEFEGKVLSVDDAQVIKRTLITWFNSIK